MARVFVGIGSNIDPQVNIASILSLLQNHFSPLRISPIYQSPAVGFSGDIFYNLVVEFEYLQPLSELIQTLSAFEQQYQGALSGLRYHPRKMDIDVLLFGDLVEFTADYEIPRSDILKFAFVLKPLVDLAPELIHPQLQLTLRQLWETSIHPHFPLKVSNTLLINSS